MYHDYVDPPFEEWVKRLPAVLIGEVQTRSETTGLMQHQTLESALQRIRQDRSVWKVSYMTKDGWRRITVPE